MKDNQVLLLILVTSGDDVSESSDSSPRSRTSTNRYRDGWDRIFSQDKGTTTHDLNVN